jgi:hypothetical protein
MAERLYGDFEYVPEERIPDAHLELSVNSFDLRTVWQRCGLLSNLVAGYISSAYFDEAKGYNSEIFSSISTIFQELIENAAKFSMHRDAVIRIRVKHYERVTRIEVQNNSVSTHSQKFEAHLKVLFTAPDLDDLQVSILESRSRDQLESGIGLLMLLKDYPVKLGVLFAASGQEKGQEFDVVTVRVYYRLEGIDEIPSSLDKPDLVPSSRLDGS